MNINASNPSLINILLQQATKSQEKKRPTFEQVFAKLNARTARIDANKNPVNNMMTNEQLFRYYIRDTEPKLSVSNETFSSDELFNPMKDKDPAKIYGRSTTEISDLIPSRDPSNNAPYVGIPDPAQSSMTPSAAAAATPPAASQYTDEEQVEIENAEMYIQSGNTFLEYFNNIDMSALSDDTKEFLNVMFYKNIQDADWSELGAYMIDRVDTDINDVIKGLYSAMIAFSAMPDGLTKDYIPYTIFRLTSTETGASREELDLIMNSTELGLRKRFNDHKNDPNVGLRLPNGKYNNPIRGFAERDFEKYKISVLDPIDAITTNFIADNQAKIKFIKTGIDFERDEGMGNPRLLEVQQARRMGGEVGVFVDNIITDMMRDLFQDDDTEMRTNTNINSVILDDQIVANIRRRDQQLEDLLASLSVPSASPPKISSEGVMSPSSTMAEAGSGEVEMENAIMRRGAGRPKGSKNKNTLRMEEEQGLRSLDLTGAASRR
jgi:hypothetical protein